MSTKKIDKIFLGTVIVLVIVGFLIFTSASLGLLARTGAKFSSVAFSQIFLGIILGSVAMYITARVPYRNWRKASFFIFLGSLFVTLLVFVPGVGFGYNGAHRWIHILGFSIQPTEILKIGFVIYFAAWLASVKDKVTTWKHGTLPLVGFLTVVGAIVLKQPDTATFAVMFFAIIGMFIAAGGKWLHIITLMLIGMVGLGTLFLTRPYIADRINTFINPSEDPFGAGYQIQQSQIAIGSGEFFGRGFGQSIQKFNYLPEPIGDSIFAVAAEEFGFVGSTFLILLYVLLAIRGLKIAVNTPDLFGRLLTTGIVILIVSGSFVNIASMLGVIPLSGLPLLFVSQGGTAMCLALAQIGIVLNISKTARL